MNISGFATKPNTSFPNLEYLNKDPIVIKNRKYLDLESTLIMYDELLEI